MKNILSIVLSGVILASLQISIMAKGIEEQIRTYPGYKLLNENKEFNLQFEEYMKWASSMAKDGNIVYKMMHDANQNIFTISMIFHEKFEFWQWLQLGHKFKDIMTVEYNQKNYPEVYPIAHRKAVIEEINLIKYYAMKSESPNLPEAAYLLVDPLVELFSVPVEKSLGRLKFNWEYLAQIPLVTKFELEQAASVFEKGGYTYKDRNKIIAEAQNYIEKNKASLMIPISTNENLKGSR